MSRSRWSRVVAAAMAVWLSLTLGEPGALHFCPAHAPVPAAAIDGATHGGHSHAVPDPAPAPGHDHASCTCLGTCNLAGCDIALPGRGATLPAPAAVQRTSAPSATLEVGHAKSSRRLPFANGPPRSVTVA